MTRHPFAVSAISLHPDPVNASLTSLSPGEERISSPARFRLSLPQDVVQGVPDIQQQMLEAKDRQLMELRVFHGVPSRRQRQQGKLSTDLTFVNLALAWLHSMI